MGGDARDEIELIQMRIKTVESKIKTLEKELETKNVMLNSVKDVEFQRQLDGKIVNIKYNIAIYKAEILKLKDEISRLETVELPKSESVDSPNIVKSTPECEGVKLDDSMLQNQNNCNGTIRRKIMKLLHTDNKLNCTEEQKDVLKVKFQQFNNFCEDHSNKNQVSL